MNETILDYMRRATDEARKSKAEDSSPRPKVGVVAVHEGSVIGAYRGELGAGDHAEFTLFNKKLPDVNLKGAELFTTLEPCTSGSRQAHKSCTDWIIERGIAKVFIGMLDPNPRVYSQGVRKLRDHGIQIDYFPAELRKELEKENWPFILQYHANPAYSGRARFNYSDNNGLFTIGRGECTFETKWTKGSDYSIHTYSDASNLVGVAIAADARSLSEIRDASVYDMSSRFRTPNEGDFVVLKNSSGFFAALRICDVRDRNRSDGEDELTFDYWILENKAADFSTVADREYTKP
jgi:pyrimidine deaminase RibD-like protein